VLETGEQALNDSSAIKSLMTLYPFDSVTTCPACGRPTSGSTVAFSTDVKAKAGSGRFVSVQTIGDPFYPHLEKHCPHCEYGWLEEPSPELRGDQ
jgi:hypothetical protein